MTSLAACTRISERPLPTGQIIPPRTWTTLSWAGVSVVSRVRSMAHPSASYPVTKIAARSRDELMLISVGWTSMRASRDRSSGEVSARAECPFAIDSVTHAHNSQMRAAQLGASEAERCMRYVVVVRSPPVPASSVRAHGWGRAEDGSPQQSAHFAL